MWLCMTNFKPLCLFTWQLHDLKVGSEAQIWQICDLELYSHFQSSKSQKSFKLHLWNFQMLWRCYICVHTSNFRPLPPFSCQLSQDLKVNFPLPPKKKKKTSITFFVCLGLKHAEKFFCVYKKFSKKIFFFTSLIFIWNVCSDANFEILWLTRKR